MQFIDMHCDTLMISQFFNPTKDLYSSDTISIDFKRMQEAGQLAQFFAVFVPPLAGYQMFHVEPMENAVYIKTLRESLLRSVEAHKDMVAMAYSAEDILANQKNGKVSAVLTMEDGCEVNGKLENIKEFYDQGFRAIGLTWNSPNCFGAPNSADPAIMKMGLTDFGKEAVEYMQELGMLVDVSHLSEGGFYDVADVCRKPFLATHSNAIALSPHQRNLTDNQIRVLGRTGSVTGLNFGPEFLNQDVTCKDSTAKLIAAHARHIVNVGGIECLGLGSDLDGIMGNLEINSNSKVYLLEDALKKQHFTESEIERIFYKNTLRVMKESM